MLIFFVIILHHIHVHLSLWSKRLQSCHTHLPYSPDLSHESFSFILNFEIQNYKVESKEGEQLSSISDIDRRKDFFQEIDSDIAKKIKPTVQLNYLVVVDSSVSKHSGSSKSRKKSFCIYIEALDIVPVVWGYMFKHLHGTRGSYTKGTCLNLNLGFLEEKIFFLEFHKVCNMTLGTLIHASVECHKVVSEYHLSLI